MIYYNTLMKWASEHAFGRSASFPKGWIKAEDLKMLALQMEKTDPLGYELSLQNNLPDWRTDNG